MYLKWSSLVSQVGSLGFSKHPKTKRLFLHKVRKPNEISSKLIFVWFSDVSSHLSYFLVRISDRAKHPKSEPNCFDNQTIMLCPKSERVQIFGALLYFLKASFPLPLLTWRHWDCSISLNYTTQLQSTSENQTFGFQTTLKSERLIVRLYVYHSDFKRSVRSNVRISDSN